MNTTDMRDVGALAGQIIDGIEAELRKAKLVLPNEISDEIFYILFSFIKSKNPEAEYKHHM